MNILERVKKICLTPQTEWPVISSETTPTAGLITGYVLPLAAVSAVAGLIGGSLIGQTVPFLGTYRVPLTTGLGIAVFAVCTAVIAVFVISFIINALAPSFGAEKNSAQALKVAVYCVHAGVGRRRVPDSSRHSVCSPCSGRSTGSICCTWDCPGS